MHATAGDHAPPADDGGDPIDVTALPLPELVWSDDTVLSNAARRALEQNDEGGVVAGWTSSLT